MKTDTALRTFALAALLLSICNAQLPSCFAQTTAFTYQGKLTDSGNLANGTFDIQASLQDASSNTVAGPLVASASVSNGLFTIALDFSAAQLTGADRWLQLAVRTNGTGPFTPIFPRQQLTSTPYAVRAANFSGAVTSAQLPANVALLNSNQTFTGQNTFSGNVSVSGGTLTLGNGSSNRISFANAGVAPPSANSAGWKIRTWDIEFGLGIDNATQWYSSGGSHRWYANPTGVSWSQTMNLDSTGTLATGGIGNSGTVAATPPGSLVGSGTGYPTAGIVVGDAGNVANVAGWGRGIYFHGGPALVPGQTGDNSDPEFIARYNVAANSSQLRMGIGDDADGNDKFVIGVTSGNVWTPKFSVDGTGAVRAAGTITASTTPDLAETIPASEDVEAGDIVCADPQRRERAIRCGKNSRAILGVISDGTGGFLINANARSVDAPLTGKPLVLVGRVPVKVSLENGPVRIGDSLAPSSTPGVAMRATEPGLSVGVALENFSGSASEPTGKVLCFVNVGEANTAKLLEQMEAKDVRIVALERSVAELKTMVAELSHSTSVRDR